LTQHSRDTPQFYLTAPSPCPYLPGRHERKVFTHLVGERAGDLNDLLTHGGFRRSQSIAYRPACDQCRACVSVRVIANEFRPSRNFRKVIARNADIIGEQRSAVPTSEQYSVFRAYLDSRHRHGGMADMTVLDYAMMVEDSHVETKLVEYRTQGPDSRINGRGAGALLGVALRLAAQPVEGAVARRRRDPRPGVVGDAVLGPALEGDDERVLHRLLGEIDVAEEADERGDGPTGLPPERGLDVQRTMADQEAEKSMTGRSSMHAPGCGILAAHFRASSRLSTSRK